MSRPPDIRSGYRSDQFVQFSAVLILPAKDAPKSPRIRIVERCAFRGPLFVMELIIAGNRPGLEKLAQRVESLDPTDSKKHAFDDHLHVNDWHDRWVVRESISLNLRAPVKCWPRNARRDYGFIFDPKLKKLPEESGYLTPETTPYALPDLKSKTFQLTDSARWS